MEGRQTRLLSAVMAGTALCLLAVMLAQAAEAQDSFTSPQFTAPPADALVAAGQMARLSCEVTGEPPPSVTWFREDGAQVQSGGRFAVSTATGELRVSAVELGDAGQYYCVATNAVGSVRSLSASLELAVFNTDGLPPEGQNLQTIPVSNRQSLILSCTVPTSYPQPSIEWEFNQALLDEFALSSGRIGITLAGDLVISSVNANADNGQFHCYVSNDVIDNSRVYTTGYLLFGPSGDAQPLSIPTQFVATPTSRTIVMGDAVEFNCFTTGNPVAEISWTKDGSPFSPTPGHASFSQAQRILTITAVTEEDAGSYVCVATVPSTGATVESPAATLTVVVPPILESSFLALAANVTQEVILSCEVVASGDGSNIDWEWRVNSSEVVTSGNVLYDRSGLVSRLQILSVLEENQGVYQCVASQVVAGGDQRQTAANERLSVILTPPTILTQPTSDLLVFEGATVTLPCTASGFPPPSFSWVKGEGTAVDQDSRVSMPAEESWNGSLTISSAMVSDSSLYQCTATNSAGSASSSASQLRVLRPSVVKLRPEDLVGGVSDGVFTAEFGHNVSIPCNVSRFQDGTTMIYKWYRDGEEAGTVQDTGLGTLMLVGVAQTDRGRYKCVVEISASGVGGQPLQEIVGAVTIGVGEPPTMPFPPTAPSVTLVTNHTLTLDWTPPDITGNLPLTAYIVEVLVLGNSLCSQSEPEWEEQQRVDDPTAVQTIVMGLIPFQHYNVRIRAVNSNFESEPSPAVESVWTQPSAPSASPSNVRIASGNQALVISWDHPNDCLTFGGPLTDYSVSYRISSESTFVTRQVGSNKTSMTLTALRAQTSYTVAVFAHTAEGAGPRSEPIKAITNECSAPAPPSNLRAEPFNSTAAVIRWVTPTDPDDLYIITWCHGNSGESTRNMVLRGGNETLVTELVEGEECEVMIKVNNRCGTGDARNITVTPLDPTTAPAVSILDKPWFIAVVAVVATLLVFGTPTIILFIVCFICRRQEGKIYIATSRRSASSLSGASTAFTEYHQKHKGIARATKITVHSEPPPPRRSTDYADLSSYNSHVSSGTPSISSYQRQTTAETNGGPPSHHHGRESPAHSNIDGDRQQMSPPLDDFTTENKRSRVAGGHHHHHHHHHHPHPHPHSHRGISSQDESTDSWSASESFTGHMTDHVIDRGANWSGRPSNQLSPLHEHQVMEMLAHNHPHDWRETPGEPAIAVGNHRHGRHSSQPLLGRTSHSPSPPPLPTSLPPPLSLPPPHTCSMDHILDHQTDHAHARPSHSQTQFQTSGIQNGLSQPILSSHHRPPSPEYAEPHQVKKEHREKAGRESREKRERRERSSQGQRMLALPPKSKSRQGAMVNSLSSAPNLLSTQLPQVPEEMTVSGPIAVADPKPPPPPVKTRRLTSERATTANPLGSQTQAGVSAVHSRQPDHSDLKGLLTQWKTNQERQQKEKVMELPRPQNGFPNVVGLLDMPDGLPDSCLETSAPASSAPSSRPSVSSQTDRWTATPSPQAGHAPHHILTSETPIVKNAPLTIGDGRAGLLTQPHPPSHSAIAPLTISDGRAGLLTQPHPPSHSAIAPLTIGDGRAGLLTQPHPPSHSAIAPLTIGDGRAGLLTQPHPPSHSTRQQLTNSHNRAELEDIYQRDPRKPRRRKGRVPGAVWKQMPMNSRIESSSSDSESDSIDSDNGSLTSEYV